MASAKGKMNVRCCKINKYSRRQRPSLDTTFSIQRRFDRAKTAFSKYELSRESVSNENQNLLE